MFNRVGFNEIDPEEEWLCESCGGNYLHHEKIEVFEPREQESVNGIKVVINKGQCEISQDMTGNPSPRRNGIRINFSCEFCKEFTILEIIQHKGNTYLTSKKA